MTLTSKMERQDILDRMTQEARGPVAVVDTVREARLARVRKHSQQIQALGGGKYSLSFYWQIGLCNTVTTAARVEFEMTAEGFSLGATTVFSPYSIQRGLHEADFRAVAEEAIHRKQTMTLTGTIKPTRKTATALATRQVHVFYGPNIHFDKMVTVTKGQQFECDYDERCGSAILYMDGNYQAVEGRHSLAKYYALS